MKKAFLLVLATFLIGALAIVFFFLPRNQSDTVTTGPATAFPNKKVLYVNAYHAGYEWSDGEQSGAEKVLHDSGIAYKTIYMDTKRNPSEEFAKQAALNIKKEIETYKPDVLIVADDAPFKYLIQPYYKDASLPVIFAGVNWNLSAYDGPYRNTTGMIEVSPYAGIVSRLKTFSKGERVGFLTGDNLSEHKNGDFLSNEVASSSTVVYVKDFTEWKKGFVEMQKSVDMLIIGSTAGIVGWDDAEAKKFVFQQTTIPTSTDSYWMTPFTLFGYTKIPQEQGETAARMAIDVLKGKAIKDIPVVTNKKGNVYVNLEMADKLGLIISPELLRNAIIVK